MNASADILLVLGRKILLCFAILFVQFGLASKISKAESSACITPFNVKLDYQSQDTAIISWTDFTSPEDFVEYQYTYHPADENVDYEALSTSENKSVTLVNLQPGRSYYFYVRTVCDDDLVTNFTSGFIFHTTIDNSQACDAYLIIPDNNCQAANPYLINVHGEGLHLGEDVFIKSVNLTIEHEWPADLELEIVSPSGVAVPLFADFGIGTSNVGDINAPCVSPLSLDMNACERISAAVPLVGSYKPVGDLELLYDNSTPNGEWQLHICDDAPGQIGVIRYAGIEFVDMSCSGPDDLYFVDISDTSLDIIIPSAGCDSLELSYTEVENGSISTFYVPCIQDTITITDLLPSTNYALEFTPICSGSIFSVSCPKEFETSCSAVELFENFDNAPSCENGCDNLCVVSSFWQNLGPAFWRTESLPTGTVLTGPSSDASGIGKYAYIESSDTLCRQSTAHLLSGCMTLIDSSSCNFGMSYHMYGNDIANLYLEISTDQQASWDTLWSISGNQGNQWNHIEISLSDYLDSIFQLRITTNFPSGNFGDLAIDNLSLSGIDLQANDLMIFRDEDMDGYGTDDVSVSFCGLLAPEGYSFLSGDCDDQNPLVSPGLEELPCNLIDDNCDGIIDEDVVSSLDYALAQQVDQTCIGIENGIIEVMAIGGTEPYQYEWVNIESTESIVDSLGAGFYQAVITDASGCMIITDSIEIQIIQQFDYLVTSIQNARCKGIMNGGIDIFHEEFNAPYTYLWNNGDTTKSITNVGPGFYELTISDVNNCLIETEPIEVFADKTLIIDIDSIADVRCFGNQDGYIDISVQNGELPLSYSWTNGSGQDSISNLIPGSYGLTVHDNENCIQEREFEVTEPQVLETDIIANDPVTCFGENNGKIEVKTSGGTAPYLYNWTNGTSGSINDHIPAGQYGVDVIDSNGCLDSLTAITVSEPESITIEVLKVTPAICENNNGSIEVDVSGGTGTYRYFWTDSVSTNNNATNIFAGIYDLTVLDAFDCKTTMEGIGVNLLETTLLVDTLAIDSLNCYGQDNADASFEIINATSFPISIVIEGDTSTYEEEIVSLSNLKAGIYNTEIRDSNGCSSGSFDFEVFQPDSLFINLLEVTANKCFGDSLGSISVEVVGGGTNYQYSWSSGDLDSLADQLPANTYDITVTDEKGCRDSLIQIEVAQPAILELDSLTSYDLTCYGSDDGRLEIYASGGTSPYQFTYNEQVFDGVQEQLPAGTYVVQVTDLNECLEISDTITIIQPDSISISIDSLKASFCENNNGLIELSAAGGTGTLDFIWSNFEIVGASAQNLLAGSYSVTVIDEKNCESSILDIPIPDISKNIELDLPNIIDASCYESADGIISYNIGGDDLLAPFDIYLNNELVDSSVDTEGLITSLEPGEYDISVIEADGCVDSISNVIINSPSEILYNLAIVSPISCFGDTNAIVAISASGGVGDFEYLWSDSSEGDTLFNVGPGLLAAAIVDGNNCVKFTDTILIAEPPILEVNLVSLDATEDNNNGAIYIETSGGTAPYMYIWDPELPTHVDTLEALGESTWEVEVVDSRGCAFDTIITIDRIVATNEFEKSQISLFPNPTRNSFSVESPTPIMSYQIFNAEGLEILRESLPTPSRKLQINSTNFADGLYLLKLTDERNKKILKSFVKNSWD